MGNTELAQKESSAKEAEEEQRLEVQERQNKAKKAELKAMMDKKAEAARIKNVTQQEILQQQKAAEISIKNEKAEAQAEADTLRILTEEKEAKLRAQETEQALKEK